MIRLIALAVVLCAGPALAQPSSAAQGILLLAHGGQPEWNARVSALASALDDGQPVEVAFGMASRPAIQGAIDRLTARGVASIVAVPLFVSSHSSVVTSTAYLLGLRDDMPPELRIFARMDHGGHGAHHGAPDAHAPEAAGADNTRPVDSRVPIRMTAALDRHPLVAEILLDRAREISTNPSREAVVLVAHGPTSDGNNARWLADMTVLAARVKQDGSFAAVEPLTVRDDAPRPVRDAAAAALRATVEEQQAAGRRVLIVPLLLSYGGIERGIRERLEGLEYAMPDRALMPDDRMKQWVLDVVRE